MQRVLLALVLAVIPIGAGAQTSAPDSPLQSAEGVVRELYRLISVAPGETTDWEKVRQLYIPEAVIVLRVKDTLSVFSVQGWIDDFVAFNERANVLERGFTEKIIDLEPLVFRDIAHVLVLYEGAITKNPKNPPTRGVDSIELIRKDGRWWIASITNDLPSAEHPVPSQIQEK